MADKMTRLEADAIASVKLDAGDTRLELDYKAAVRDFELALLQAALVVETDAQETKIRETLRKHAAAIAAARKTDD